MFTESGFNENAISFLCWALAASYSHWISIFTHDSAFAKHAKARVAVLSMSPERNNRQSSLENWKHFTQKAREVFIIILATRFNPEVLGLAMFCTHITWELHTPNFLFRSRGKICWRRRFRILFLILFFILAETFSSRLSANVRRARDKYILDSAFASECPFQWLW